MFSTLPLQLAELDEAGLNSSHRSNTDLRLASVIHTATNAVVTTTRPVGDNPLGQAVSPDGQRVYVAIQTPTR